MAEKLAEKELNAAIARLVEPDCLVFDDDGYPMLHNKPLNDFRDLNYCRDWGLVMPLAVSLGIGLDPDPTDNGQPIAYCSELALAVRDDDPRMAIAECVYAVLSSTNMNKQRKATVEHETYEKAQEAMFHDQLP